MSGYWPGPWSCEDAGPRRQQVAPEGSGWGLAPGDTLAAHWREVPLATMAVTREPGQLYLLRHTGGDQAVSFVERLDPRSLEPLGRSPDLLAGPTWPGSIGAHANGSLYVVFGNYAHRLDPELSVIAATALPRQRPYNGFVVMPDGCLVTKDFAGSRPGAPVTAAERQPCELVVLEPEGLEVVGRCTLEEPSVARLSADGDTLYVVGDTSVFRVRWDGRLTPDADFSPRYRRLDGQSYGWDCVVASGAAWFLDDGEGSEAYSGTLRGHGVSRAPLHLVRVALDTAEVTMAEICGLPGGLVANPPVVDEKRSIALGYDSGNGVIQAFTVGPDGQLAPRWRREQDHGSHLVLFADTGEVVTAHHDRGAGVEYVVVLDIDSGQELARAPTGSPVQSVLFPAVGFEGELFLCSFTTVTRVTPDRAT